MDAVTDVRSLADAIDKARPDVSHAGRLLIAALYRLLARGEPVAPSDVAAATGLHEREIERFLASWPAVYRDDRGRIVGFWGMTVREMPPHEIVLDGRRMWAWCAWDTLFLPRRLGGTLDVTSRCPTTGEEVRLRVAPDEVIAAEPAKLVVSMMEPSAPFDADVIATFCHYVHFFVDKQAGERWTSEHPGTFLMSLEEAFELARLTNEMLLPTST